MSDVGGPLVEPRLGPAPAPGSTQVSIWVLVVAVALLLVTAGGAAYAWSQSRAEATGPTYPAAWDSRVLPYVKIAEKQRDLRFLHPVAVRFLPAKRFEKTVTQDEKSLDRKERAEVAHFIGQMRAFGLVSGDVDLFHAFNQSSGAGTLAYYSYDTKSITVRGMRVTPAVKSTLVHELTHVLQDQHFGVGDQLTRLRKQKSTAHGDTETQASVLDAIVEGDAERVQQLYRASLSQRKRAALDASRQSQDTEGSQRLAGVPKVVLTLMSSPYTLGAGLVQAVAADGGNSAVDDLLRDPPTHETALLDPLRADRAADTVTVARPQLGAGEKKFDDGEVGVLTWYLMLVERLPLNDALSVSDGWGVTPTSPTRAGA